MSDSTDLEGTTIGICLAPEGSEETEFTEPRDAVADAGATVEVLGSETDETEIVNNDLESGGGYEIERVSRREKRVRRADRPRRNGRRRRPSDGRRCTRTAQEHLSTN